DELAARGETRGRQILRDLGLAIDGDRSTREPLQVDMRIASVENEIEAVMGERLATHPIGNPGRDQKIDRSRFQDPGADAAFDMGATAALQNDIVDSLSRKEPREEQARRTGPDDDDLRAQSTTLKCSGRRPTSPRRRG